MVKDSGGNVAPNASVTFTAPSTGASANFLQRPRDLHHHYQHLWYRHVTCVQRQQYLRQLLGECGGIRSRGAGQFQFDEFRPPGTHHHRNGDGSIRAGPEQRIRRAGFGRPNAGPTYGTVTVTVGLSSGLTLTGMNGGSTWTCTVATASCSTSRVLNPGNSYGLITVTVAVAYGATTASGQAGVSDAGSLPITTAAPTPVFTACDLTLTGSTTVGDVQTLINEVLGNAPPSHDLTGDGAINILDVQIMVRSALGGACSAS